MRIVRVSRTDPVFRGTDPTFLSPAFLVFPTVHLIYPPYTFIRYYYYYIEYQFNIISGNIIYTGIYLIGLIKGHVIRLHQALNGKTPAEVAGLDIELDENKWKSLIEKAVKHRSKSGAN
jgi:hypothetical protein